MSRKISIKKLEKFLLTKIFKKFSITQNFQKIVYKKNIKMSIN